MWQLGVAGLGFDVASRGVVSDVRCTEEHGTAIS